ncbi:MAG TPA: hypothetical protein VFV71_06550 [Burkholderiales bacterium]|nr:hypothetical protein [Burkholderiales bacterium]
MPEICASHAVRIAGRRHGVPCFGRRAASALAAALAFALLVPAAANGAAPATDEPKPIPPPVLRAKSTDLAARFDASAFGRPLVLESSEVPDRLRGDVFARLDHPYALVRGSLQDAGQWCEVLILHLNVKYCRQEPTAQAIMLAVGIGPKSGQLVEKSFRVEFSYRVVRSAPDHLAIVLSADKGPVGTRDYRILFEAVPVNDAQTFMHLAYAYGYGRAARLGLMAYLGTSGAHKVGFTVARTDGSGQPVYVDGLRGLVERNAMRYYLAIESYLGALSLPAAERPEKRFADWYAAIERYPRQLHELDREDYLEMKRREYRRQQSMP